MPVAGHPTSTVRGHKTVGLPYSQEQDERIVEDRNCSGSSWTSRSKPIPNSSRPRSDGATA